MRALGLATLGVLCTLLGSGCALLSKSDPLTPRYFSAEDTSGGAVEAQPSQRSAGNQGDPLRLRLGRIDAGSGLRERIVYRTSPDEVGFYEDRRWTERPEDYLRHALSRALFERHGFSRAVSGAAPTLQAELLAFEEVRGDHPGARVTLVFTLDDEHDTLLEQTLTIERPLAPNAGSDRGAAVANAMTAALHEAVETIAQRVTVALSDARSKAPQ
ncbi:MAG TPA: ABC-type transport auxiliary lipoprotein family protein [Polyangiales bacterium]|nr:ABC-type transport auxiliary lipoprotein family protein [Polyangiales bacterium]